MLKLSTTILDRISRFQLDPERDAESAEHERFIADATTYDERERRRQWLDDARVRFKPADHEALIRNEGMRATASLAIVRAWQRNPKRKPWLVIVGGTGCGKSYGAAWGMLAGPESHVWMNIEDAIRVFAQYFDAKMLARQEAAKFCKLLVLDDVGTPKSEQEIRREQALLLELLKAREARDTIVPCNLERAAWLLRFRDERVHSRLEQQAMFVIDNGPDLRSK